MQTRSQHPAQSLSTVFGPRAPELAAAARADLAACRAALRHGSKTFLAASFLLPRDVHEPASALYAFCRLADDAVDVVDAADSADSVESVDAGAASGTSGRAAVERLRERLRLAYAGTPQDDPADRALAVVVARYEIPAALFDALLEGFAWDCEGRRYDTLESLHDYAARVAGTVGAMMALLMGVRSPEALARACDLGVAMQLSNIARDVGEDARMGRLYLPHAWMREAGLDPDAWLAAPVFTPALGAVVRRLLDAAKALYESAGAGVARLPLTCRPGINAARFMYAEIGHEVARRGFDSVGARARVGARRKLGLLLRSLAASATRAPDLLHQPHQPVLPANRFLIDAVLAGAPRAELPAPRGLAGRMVWTLELFAQLEQRDRVRAAGMGQAADLAT